MKVKELINDLQEYNPEAEIDFFTLGELSRKYFEIYYRGGPDDGNKKTCEIISFFLGNETDFKI